MMNIANKCRDSDSQCRLRDGCSSDTVEWRSWMSRYHCAVLVKELRSIRVQDTWRCMVIKVWHAIIVDSEIHLDVLEKERIK